MRRNVSSPWSRGKRSFGTPNREARPIFYSVPFLKPCIMGPEDRGKLNGLLWSYAQHVGKGHGAAWAGIIFRQTYPQLADVQAKSEKWFRQVFPNAQFNRTRMVWEWPDGERLLLRHIARPADYWCVPFGEVLTKQGWVSIENVKVGDVALTCNPKTKELEWLPVATKTCEEYEGDIVKYEGRGTHMEMTPGHKVVTADGELVRYWDLPRHTSIMAGGLGIE